MSELCHRNPLKGQLSRMIDTLNGSDYTENCVTVLLQVLLYYYKHYLYLTKTHRTRMEQFIYIDAVASDLLEYRENI